MSYLDLCVTRPTAVAGDVPRLGEPLLDRYLEFVAARCRPNTVLAVAFDLKVSFGVVGKAPAEVTAADVLGFITAQRAGTASPSPVAVIDDADVGCPLGRCVAGCRRSPGCSGSFKSTVRLRPTRCPGACRRGGNALGHGRACRCCGLRGRCRRSCPRSRSMP